jgi:hypothetical protein
MGGNGDELTELDDDFHDPPDDSWWWHETCWFWFFVPERSLGGWLYNYIRPNIGVAGGGCWVWDDTTTSHWEVPYYAGYSNLRLPEERDLRNFRFPSGVEVTAVDPLRRYRLGYADRDLIQLDLDWDAITPPWVASSDGVAHHFDQVGRVTGSLLLHGEQIEVDCLAIRDRTWTVRSERWKHGGGYGYTNATASADLGFLAVGDTRQISGYLLADGERRGVVSGSRVVERDPDSGWVRRVRVELLDDAGREMAAEGRPVSRMAMPIPGVAGVVWTSLVDWQLDGTQAWGEDQEPWPVVAWSRLRAS